MKLRNLISTSLTIMSFMFQTDSIEISELKTTHRVIIYIHMFDEAK